jgi:hypothetical protein
LALRRVHGEEQEADVAEDGRCAWVEALAEVIGERKLAGGNPKGAPSGRDPRFPST